MKIETKFNVGDTFWYFGESGIKSSKIDSINIVIRWYDVMDVSIKYECGSKSFFECDFEKRFWTSKKDVIAYLSQ